jgi:hypothetical protein
VPDRYHHVLVRVHQDRRLLGQTQSLYEYLCTQPSEGTYTVQIKGDPRKKQTAREALFRVSRSSVEIQRPDKLKGKDYPPSIRLYAVEAQEINAPAGQTPIHWRLMTSHCVVSLEQALQIIQWYCWRCGSQQPTDISTIV